jgi:hypothetical protein
MSSAFFKQATKKLTAEDKRTLVDHTNAGERIIMDINPEEFDKKFSLDLDNETTKSTDTIESPKGLINASFTEETSLLVPSKRSEMKELFVANEKIVMIMDDILRRIKIIEQNISLLENNNNISDSDMKKFFETVVNNSLEQFKEFVVTSSENLDMEDNDVILVVKNAPSKQMLKINNDVAKDILERGGKCYVTENAVNLSKQLHDINQETLLEKKEDPSSRKQRQGLGDEDELW